MLFVLHQGVLAGSAPGTIARLAMLGDVLWMTGPIDREVVLSWFTPTMRPEVCFDLPDGIADPVPRRSPRPAPEQRRRRHDAEDDAMDNQEGR